MKIIFKEENLFIPTYNGNAKQPESEKIRVYWRYPDSAEVKDIRGYKNPRMVVNAKKGKGKKADNEMEVEVFVDYIIAVKKLVTRIENLEVNGQKIESGEILAMTAGMNALTDEVAAEIIAGMDRTQDALKNS
jgi:hypothetical protein